MKALKLVNGIPRLVELAAAYDEVYAISTTIATGTPITLPNSGSYTTGKDLIVFLNDVLLEPIIDYNYVGSSPRTQITLTFDLYNKDRIRFRI